jgi:peptide/nickel transport system permease protein
MNRYVANRIALLGPTLLLMSLIVFFVMRVLPGDAADVILAEEGGRVDPALREQIRNELGLNRPLAKQYVDWLGDALRLEFGHSLIKKHVSVGTELKNRLVPTLELTVLGMLLATVVSVPLGVASAILRNRWPDLAIRMGAFLGLSLPHFVFGSLILLVLVSLFGWRPSLTYHSLLDDPWANLTQMIWPALVVAWSPAAVISRLVRSSMLEIMRMDYVRTAHAKGLNGLVIIRRHMLPNAMLPIITLIGAYFGHLIAGVVITEQIFNVPGVGSFLIAGVHQRDYPIVQGTVLVVAFLVTMVNFAVDLVYSAVDPRIRV